MILSDRNQHLSLREVPVREYPVLKVVRVVAHRGTDLRHLHLQDSDLYADYLLARCESVLAATDRSAAVDDGYLRTADAREAARALDISFAALCCVKALPAAERSARVDVGSDSTRAAADATDFPVCLAIGPSCMGPRIDGEDWESSQVAVRQPSTLEAVLNSAVAAAAQSGSDYCWDHTGRTAAGRWVIATAPKYRESSERSEYGE